MQGEARGIERRRRDAHAPSKASIGRYQIVGHLATGGMAEILLGRLDGPSGFERIVVVKRILPHLARARAFIDMFLDEARLLAEVRHPNVVHVHELGDEDGELFLVMEYIDGESIAGLLKRLWSRDEELGPALAAHLIAEACAGLHAAHELRGPDGTPRALVHRDVSPQNVMITYAGQVKVLDFGIAHANDRLARTQAGYVKGRCEYMSPEQCLGQPLDRRSDIFSLGVLLYELSANRRLFKRSNELATLKAITEEPIRPPSSAVSGYPPSLEAICLRALARNRDDRYATAADMRSELAHELGAGAASADALGRLMQRIFSDRIAEKNEVLARVRAGVSVAVLPDADPEGDLDVDASGDDAAPPDAPTTATTAMTTATVRSRRRRRNAVLLGVTLGTTGVALAVAPGLFRDDALTVLTEAPAAAETAAVAASASAAQPAATIVLHVETTPPGATVSVDGRDEGVTPASLELPARDKPVLVEVRREGFSPWSRTITPDANQRLVLTLQPAPRARSARRSAAPTTSATPRPEPTFWRLP
jgi:serine/threonine-protein kinase